MSLILLLAALLAAALAIIFSLARRLAARSDEAAALRADNARLDERLRLLSDEAVGRRADDEARFKALAAEVINANSLALSSQQAQRLDDILRPLKNDIDGFRRSVAESYDREARERFSLMKQIEMLVRTGNTLGDEARQLSRALRGDAKTQGDWGEVMLESILEKSGLRRGEEYEVQLTRDDSGLTLRDDEGRGLRPDVVVRYPGKRVMVIDSKVSLTAYIDYINASDEAEAAPALDRHVASVRAHIRELADKNYQQYVGDGSTEFVMMFIPNEGAYMAALRAVPSLWQEAYDRRVLVVSPTHLVSALKLVSQLWTHDRQTRNAIEIATAAGRLYDKFAGFVTDLNTVGRNLDTTRRTLDAALNKLTNGTGNLLSRIEHLRDLGAKATKNLPTP